jgi:dipicolinate synthase subunit A
VAGNACLTAEGAIGLAIQEYKGALGGARCLVTGYGRIGRALCGMLRGMGAQVDCAARKAKDLTLIRASGCRAVAYQELGDRYELIFNTVPARVLGQRVLAAQSPEGLILELASPPGGVDLEAAGRLGLRVLPAPSLPGKLSPKASGELIKEAVYNILEEQRGGLWARP